MRQRTVDMLQQLARFERADAATVRRLAAASPRTVIDMARYGVISRAVRPTKERIGIARAREEALLDMQFSIAVRDAAVRSGDPQWRALTR